MNKVKQIIENGDIDELDRLVDGFCCDILIGEILQGDNLVIDKPKEYNMDDIIDKLSNVVYSSVDNVETIEQAVGKVIVIGDGKFGIRSEKLGTEIQDITFAELTEIHNAPTMLEVFSNLSFDEETKLLADLVEEWHNEKDNIPVWNKSIPRDNYFKSTNNKQSYNVKQPKFHIRRGLKKKMRSGE